MGVLVVAVPRGAVVMVVVRVAVLVATVMAARRDMRVSRSSRSLA